MAKKSAFSKVFDTVKGLNEGTLDLEANQVVSVAADRIRPGLIQYRAWFDPERIKDLAQTFRSVGFRGALLVHPDPEEEGYYRLIGGERSWRAGQLIGMTEFPAIVVADLDMNQIAELAFNDNAAAEALSDYENLLGILDILRRNMGLEEFIDEDGQVIPHPAVTSLLYAMERDLKKYRAGNKGEIPRGTVPPVADFTQREGADVVEAVFDRLPIKTQWPGFVQNWLPLLTIPQDCQQAIIEGRVDPTKAKLIAKVADAEQRSKLLLMAENVSMPEVKRAIAELQKPSQEEPAAEAPPEPPAKRLSAVAKAAKTVNLPPKAQKRFDNLLAQLEQLITAHQEG